MIQGFFKSHLYTLVIFSIIVSILISFIRYDKKKDIIKYALKLFCYMTVGVIIFSWIMRFF